jgi:hypothetical protein
LIISTNLTNVIILVPEGSNSLVTLDASRSFDVEQEPLQFQWFEGDLSKPIAAGVQAAKLLGLGTHTILLSVSDGNAIGTAVLRLEIVNPCLAVKLLAAALDEANPDSGNTVPLHASLRAACISFEHGNLLSGVKQLEAFQSKLRGQGVRLGAGLVEDLSRQVDRIIKVLAGH